MPKELENSLYETILKSDLPFVIQNFGEVALDSLSDDGIFKSIPILGTIFAIGKIFGNVIDYFFAKKMIAFLRSLSSLSETERQQLIHRLDTDEKFSKYAGEQIIELLSRIDSDRKAVLVATALKFYVRGEIDSLQLQRINYAIDRFMLCDTEEFRSFCSIPVEKVAKEQAIAATNFLSAGLGGISMGWGMFGMILPNETARLFLRVLDEGLQ
ncbi:hypothetical protein VU07_03130 [Desulfobulbus sp. F4]|nr:hypothetical protein [Desulfobulbus sp. F4]